MGADLMSIAYAAGNWHQTLTAVQTQLLRNTMDIQAQNAQALLQLMAEATATAAHPHLGNNLDVYV